MRFLVLPVLLLLYACGSVPPREWTDDDLSTNNQPANVVDYTLIDDTGQAIVETEAENIQRSPSVLNNNDNPPSAEELNRFESVQAPDERLVYFDYDSAQASDEAKNTIRSHANYLRSNPSIRVRLEGHTDERGTREYNLSLGELRALTVRDLLLAHGVNANQIYVISYGEERPIVEGDKESAWSQNRRVEFVY